MKTVIGLIGALLLSGCATSFTGSAHIGPNECAERCREIGGHMDSYVYMGQYSTACVCRPGSAPSAGPRATGSEGSVAGAVAGVWMQMQENDRRRRQANQ